MPEMWGIGPRFAIDDDDDDLYCKYLPVLLCILLCTMSTVLVLVLSVCRKYSVVTCLVLSCTVSSCTCTGLRCTVRWVWTAAVTRSSTRSTWQYCQTMKFKRCSLTSKVSCWECDAQTQLSPTLCLHSYRSISASSAACTSLSTLRTIIWS